MTGHNPVAVRLVCLALLGVYVEAEQRYLTGWSDQVLADRLHLPVAVVMDLRAAAFGPGAEATHPWRQRQAALLLERHFDPTERLGARDVVAAKVGEDDLYRLQLAGQAPAGGLYQAGWSDDRISELTGVSPGDVYALRTAIRWLPPDDRPAARRRRETNALAPTRAGRVMRLSDEVDPRTGERYTLEGLADALVDAGEVDTVVAGRREELLQWVETTLAAGRARLDSDGRRRTVVTTARALGFTRQWTCTLLARFEADPEVGKRGKPSLLTPEVIARLRALDARRFDRASWYGWLAGVLWPTKRPTTRTLKGWRERGLVDANEGRKTIYSEFDAAFSDLVARAPADAPILPDAAELASVANLSERRAAEALGCTVEQLKAAKAAAKGNR